MGLVQRGGQQLHQRANLGLDASTWKKKPPSFKRSLYQGWTQDTDASGCLDTCRSIPLENYISKESTPTVVRLVQEFLNSRLSGHQEVCEGLAGRTLLQEHYRAEGLSHSLV